MYVNIMDKNELNIKFIKVENKLIILLMFVIIWFVILLVGLYLK